MSFFITYQVQDSSVIGDSAKNNLNGLDLINEVDDSIEFLVIKKYNKVINDTSSIDTFYGIKNQKYIPVREVEYSTSTETVIEKLFTPTIISREIAGWQIIILLMSIILLGISKAFSRNRFNLAIKSLLNYGVAQEVTREEKVFFHRSNVLLTMIHLLTASLLLYHIKEIINLSNLISDGFFGFLLILFAVTIIYIVKYIFSQVLFFVLNDVSIISEYIFNVSLFNNLLGVIFIPTLCLSYFSSFSFSVILLYLVIPLSLITFVLRLIRLFVIGKTKGISYFYIFLYICTLEILPLVVLFRIFIFK